MHTNLLTHVACFRCLDMVSAAYQLQSWVQSAKMAEGAFAFVVALEWTVSAWIPVLVTAATIIISTICFCGGFFSRHPFSGSSNIPASEIADPGASCAAADSGTATDSGVAAAADSGTATDSGAADSNNGEVDCFSFLQPGTPKSVRLNRAFCNHGVDYDADLIARFERLGIAGLTAWECSEKYEYRDSVSEQSNQAGSSGDRVSPHVDAGEGNQDRLGSSWESLRHFSRAELNLDVWISRNNRAYAFHRARCAIKVTAKRWLTLELALKQGKNPCQQCCSDYAKRLL